ncbi:MAG: hypothetical protein NZ580_07045 [Bacteroidia bacterium]|nr:hypothetical protein [Bacteroidia bacterium]MDW8236206.1 hypothetical protein [Bacteroidia bacterium]
MLYRRWLPLLLAKSLLVWACSPRLPELDRIEQLQKEMRRTLNTEGPKSGRFLNLALDLVRAEEAFVQKYPNHLEVPHMLLEIAEINATYFDDPRTAVGYLRRIDTQFRKKSPLAPKALFYEAFIYENMLYDTTQARRLYEDFLSHYPEHELADEVRASLANLGKTPEGLLEEILKGSRSSKSLQ